MLRRFLIAIVIFLVVVVVAADRVGAMVASHVLAGKVESLEKLPTRPSVSIDGIPFLTQAFGGSYHDVSITAQGVPVNGVGVTTLTVHLHGVHLPLSKSFHGTVHEVPVDRADGSAYVSFNDANNYLARHPVNGQLITLGSATGGHAVTVTDQTRVGGKRVTVHGTGEVTVTGNVITVTVSRLSTAKQGGGQTEITRITPRQPLRVTVPLQGLPFRLQLNAVTSSSSGVTATGGATNIVLGGPTQ